MYAMKHLSKTLFSLLLLTFIAVPVFGQHVHNESPAFTATCVDLDTDITWSTTGGVADKFHLEVAEDSSFSNPIVDEPDLTSKTFTVDLPDYETVYLWRVSATFTDQSTDVSEIWRFTTKDAPPVNQYPVDSAECVNLDATFIWEDYDGAQSYDFQISHSASFTDFVEVATGLNSNTYTFSLPEYDTDYFYRVRAEISGDCISDWSEPTMFTTNKIPPTAISPSNDALGMDTNVFLRWGGALSADFHELQVSTTPDFSNVDIVDATNLTESSYTVTSLDYNTKYYWRLSAQYSDCHSSWSKVRNFKTGYAPVTLKQPETGMECVDMEYMFTWEDAGAEGYRLQIATNPDFDDPLVNQDEIESPFLQVKLEDPITVHWWRVRAEDSLNTGNWSASRTFTSSLDPPEHVFPDHGLAGLTLDVKLSWQEDVEGSTYRLQVATSANFDQDQILDSTNISQPQADIELEENFTEYYWRVKALYSSCSSSWSEPTNFTTVIGPPELIDPEDGAEKLSLKPVFTWKKAKGATDYELNVASDPNFENIVKGKRGISANVYKFTTPFDVGTDYWWRVRASNADGTSIWSEARKLSTGGLGAEVPELIMPDNRAEKVPVEPTVFKWHASERADNYHIQVSKRNTFFQTAYENETVTDTTVDVPGLENYTEYYWRVASINDSGRSEWSEIWKFRTIALAPDAGPDLNTPLDGLEKVQLPANFSWDEVERAVGYHLQVSTDDAFETADIVFDDDKIYDNSQRVHVLDLETTYYWHVRGFNEAGSGPWSETWSFTTTDGTSVHDLTDSPFESTVSPNPFSETAVIGFTLPEPGKVTVKIYNVLGEEVTTLTNEMMSAGPHTVNWDPNSLKSGAYIYVISSNGKQEVKRVMLTR